MSDITTPTTFVKTSNDRRVNVFSKLSDKKFGKLNVKEYM